MRHLKPKINNGRMFVNLKRKCNAMATKSITKHNAGNYNLRVVKCQIKGAKNTNTWGYNGFHALGRGLFIISFVFVFMLSIHKLFSSNNISYSKTNIYTNRLK